MSDQKPVKAEKRAKALPEHMNRGLRRVVRIAVNTFMHIAFRMVYVDTDKIVEDQAVLMISNHSSIFDVPAIHVNFKPWVYFVAKEELFKSRFANSFLKWWGAIPINRDKTSLSTAREIFARLKEEKIVSIFPEGTRVPEGADKRDYLPKVGVLHFAKRSHAMIQPVGIQGPFKFRGRVTVTVGDAFSYEDLATGPEGKRSDDEMLIEMMRRVYALNGVDYLAGE